jgi:hypothetical protein
MECRRVRRRSASGLVTGTHAGSVSRDSFVLKGVFYEGFEVVVGIQGLGESVGDVFGDGIVPVHLLFLEFDEQVHGLVIPGDADDVSRWRGGDDVNGHRGIIIAGVSAIKIVDLARKLNVPPSRVQSLVGTHLRAIDKWSVVSPSASTLDWLHNMLRPVVHRPLIRLEEVSGVLGLSVSQLRDLCALPSPIPIPISLDPVFGDLLSPIAVHALITRAQPQEISPGLGRAQLLLWMCGLDHNLKRKPKPYSRQLEDEIHRIARLKEPNRTIRAVELLVRFVDAKLVAKAVLEVRLPAELERIETRLEELAGGS